MRKIVAALVVAWSIVTLAMILSVARAPAAGWESVHRFVHPTGRCSGAREVMASYYWTGERTATGERFDPDGLTTAAWEYPLGARLTVRNPANGRAVSVRVNDRGPNGIARRMGDVLDLSRGAARQLGMTATAYVCVTR